MPRLAILALLVLLQAAFAFWTATSAWSFPHFLLAAAAFVLLPGRVVVRALRLRACPLEETTLSLVVGAVAAASFYWLSMRLGVPRLFLVWPLAGLAAAFALRHAAIDAPRASAREQIGLAALVLLGLLPLVLIPIYYRNASRLATGGMRFYPFQDVVFHLGIANELTHSIPPQAPFLPGTPLSYHYGTDLVAAMMAREGLLSVLDLGTRFLPTFFVGVTILAGFCLARGWLRSGWGALAATFLMVFGEDFSFLAGLFRPAAEPWAMEFFGMPTIVSLYLMNPMLPALALLCAGLFCLMKSLEDGGRRWGLLAAALFAALAMVKVFTLAHVLASVALAGLVHRWRFGDGRLLTAAAWTLLLTVPLLAAAWLGGGPKAVVDIHPWPYVPAAIIKLGWWSSPLGEHLDEWLRRGHLTLAALVAFFGVALPVYLIGSLGLRVLAAPSIVKELARPSGSAPLRLALAVFVILGPLISLSCAVTPASYPPRTQYNNAVWFFVQSKYLAWLFVVDVLVAWWRRGGPGRRTLIVLMAAALSLPSTIQYLAFQLREPEMITLEPSALEMTGFLDRAAPPGTVVLSRDLTARVVLALTRCRTPEPTIFPSYFISRGELERQTAELAGFWSSWRAGVLQKDVLDRYRADYAVVDVQRDGIGPPSADLQLRFENQAFRVYAVRR